MAKYFLIGFVLMVCIISTMSGRLEFCWDRVPPTRRPFRYPQNGSILGKREVTLKYVECRKILTAKPMFNGSLFGKRGSDKLAVSETDNIGFRPKNSNDGFCQMAWNTCSSYFSDNSK